MSCDVGHRLGSDPAWLWLWCGLAAAVPILPLAWELPYAAGVVLKRLKKKKISRDSIFHMSELSIQNVGSIYVF